MMCTYMCIYCALTASSARITAFGLAGMQAYGCGKMSALEYTYGRPQVIPHVAARGLQGKKSFEFTMVPRRLSPPGRDLVNNGFLDTSDAGSPSNYNQHIRYLHAKATRNRVKKDLQRQKLFCLFFVVLPLFF